MPSHFEQIIVGKGPVQWHFHKSSQPEVEITFPLEGLSQSKSEIPWRCSRKSDESSKDRSGGVTEQRASSRLVFLVKGRKARVSGCWHQRRPASEKESESSPLSFKVHPRNGRATRRRRKMVVAKVDQVNRGRCRSVDSI